MPEAAFVMAEDLHRPIQFCVNLCFSIHRQPVEATEGLPCRTRENRVQGDHRSAEEVHRVGIITSVTNTSSAVKVPCSLP